MAQQRNGTAASAASNGADETSLGELVSSASRDLSTLVRSEIALAKSELRTEVKTAAVGGGMFGGAAFFGLFALMLLSFAAAYGVDVGLPTWLAFLIIGAGYLLIAGVLVLIGVKALKKVGPPETTLRTTKETIEVLKTRGKGKREADQLDI